MKFANFKDKLTQTFERLNKIDVQNIDLQNINFVQILRYLAKRQELVLTVLLVGLTFLGTIQITKGQRTKTRYLKARVQSLQEKITAIEHYKTIQTDLTTYLKQVLPGMSENEMMDKISDYAVNSRVRIVGLSPAEKNRTDLYDQTRVQISVESPHYGNLMYFLEQIETSPYAVGIENFTGQLQPAATETEESVILARINIYALHFKNE